MVYRGIFGRSLTIQSVSIKMVQLENHFNINIFVTFQVKTINERKSIFKKILIIESFNEQNVSKSNQNSS